MRILVTGSRDWADGDSIEQAIIEVVSEFVSWEQPVTVVHGGARGADSIAASVARKYALEVECHPAAWDTRGRAAGIIRNSEMVNAGADVCLAFIRNGSRGATHCADAAEKAGIPTRRAFDPCRCDCPQNMHIGEIGCPCGLPDEPPCAPTHDRAVEREEEQAHG